MEVTPHTNRVCYWLCGHSAEDTPLCKHIHFKPPQTTPLLSGKARGSGLSPGWQNEIRHQRAPVSERPTSGQAAQAQRVNTSVNNFVKTRDWGGFNIIQIIGDIFSSLKTYILNEKSTSSRNRSKWRATERERVTHSIPTSRSRTYSMYSYLRCEHHRLSPRPTPNRDGFFPAAQVGQTLLLFGRF